jgi:hypothetical protein
VVSRVIAPSKRATSIFIMRVLSTVVSRLY